jgi:hypothetical protein
MIMVLFVVFIIAVLGFAAISIATLDSRSATQDYVGTCALDCALAGLQRAKCQLEEQMLGQRSPTWPQTFYVNGSNATNGSYTVNVTSSGSGTNLWFVTSQGAYSGALRNVQAWMSPDSFAKYAYFTNSETNNGSPIYFVTGDHLTGLVHTNGYFSLAGNPQFSTKVDSANQGDSFYHAATGTYTEAGISSPTDTTQFYHYNTSYAADHPSAYQNSPTYSFNGGQPVVNMPASTANVQANANISISGPNGANANVTLSYTASGVTVNPPASGSIVINNNGVQQTLTSTARPPYPTFSTTLSTIYVTGTATASGTVSGRTTLGASNGINIPSSLVYNDPSKDVLGLISDGNVTVTATSPGNLTIDAEIMSINGSFTVNNYSGLPPMGTLNILGGLVQNQRGAVGTFSGSPPTLRSGFLKNYVYDNVLLSTPPPNWPTTGQVHVLNIEDMGALGH